MKTFRFFKYKANLAICFKEITQLVLYLYKINKMKERSNFITYFYHIVYIYFCIVVRFLKNINN